MQICASISFAAACGQLTGSGGGRVLRLSQLLPDRRHLLQNYAKILRAN
jgi:hypothetical protein